MIATSVFTNPPALAHPSFAMFDTDKNLTYVGVVVDYKWEIPHTHIILKVAPGAEAPAKVIQC